MKRKALVIKSQDNVATAIKDIQSGQRVLVGQGDKLFEILVVNDIPFGHKFALHKIARGEDVLKYAAVIGRALKDIHPGEHVHVHNVESLRGRGDLA